MATIKVKTVSGQEVEIDDKQLVQLTGRQAQGSDPEIAALRADVQALTQTVTKQNEDLAAERTKREASELALRRGEIERIVDEQITKGKLVKDQRDEFIELGLSNRAMFDKMVAKLVPVVALRRELGHGGKPEDTQQPPVQDGNDPIAYFEGLVDAEAARINPKDPLSASDKAMAACSARYPKAAEAYRMASRVEVVGAE